MPPASGYPKRLLQSSLSPEVLRRIDLDLQLKVASGPLHSTHSLLDSAANLLLTEALK